ncbi:hypothetical protein [Alkalihalobacillus sp. CinArs1]|nr:hypothetical protein [Alkalihalobacillus sp. CinArs1]
MVQRTAQINAAIDGGSNIPTPDLSIEVDDLEEALWVMKEARV